MILLQASLFLGFLILPLPFVTFAHVCGIHFFLMQFLKRADDFSLFKRIILAIVFLVIVYIAFYAIIIWSGIFGLLSLFVVGFPIIGISLAVIIFIGLLVGEAWNIYYQFFEIKNDSFSIKNYSLSLALSIGVFAGTMLVVWFFIKDGTFSGT